MDSKQTGIVVFCLNTRKGTFVMSNTLVLIFSRSIFMRHLYLGEKGLKLY